MPEADVDATLARGRFGDPVDALRHLDQALPGLERGPDVDALLLTLFARALLIRMASRPTADVIDAANDLERAALERRAPVWGATATALRARARLDAGDVGTAMNELARVHLDQIGPTLAERPGLLLLDTLAGAYARMRLDERVDEVRGRLEESLAAATPADRAVHWSSWSTQLAARALDPVAAGRGDPDQALLERALSVSVRLDQLSPAVVPDQLRRAVQGVRALAAAYRGRPSEALRLLGQDAFGEAKDLPPLERQIVTLAAIHAHALVGSVATARSLDDAATPAPAGLPHLVLDACRARERLWLETHAGGSVVPVLGRLDDVLARIGWLGMDLVAQTARQMLEHQALRLESRTDPLTGVGNRRALDEELRHMLRFTPMPLALVLVDIDDFKQVNDAFTHVVGDEVLRRVAGCLVRELRAGDHLARYGGDEFIALLPRTGDQEARQVAQRMADSIARMAWFELADGLAVGVTTGSAALWSLTGRRPDRDAENLFRRADEALLEAKRRRAEGSPPVTDWPPSRRRDRPIVGDQPEVDHAWEPEPSPPGYSRPSYSEPSYPEPSYFQPSSSSPSSSSPSSQPSYSDPSVPASGYPEPTYPASAFPEPVSPEPAHSERTYSEPRYSEPAYPEPRYPGPAYPDEPAVPPRRSYLGEFAEPERFADPPPPWHMANGSYGGDVNGIDRSGVPSGPQRVRSGLSSGGLRIEDEAAAAVEAEVNGQAGGFPGGPSRRHPTVIDLSQGSGRRERSEPDRFDANRFDADRFDPDEFDPGRFDSDRFNRDTFDQDRLD
jgi:diguanylate cyclase (GGDEF)-like protein